MENNQNDKSSQQPDSKSNQPPVQEVKKTETNSKNPIPTQDKQPGSQQNNQNRPDPTSTSNKKITDVPGTEKPKKEVTAEESTEETAEKKA